MTHYIDKDALVAEINKRLKANGAFDEVSDEAYAEDRGMCEAYRSILSFINTLEVKEDLEIDEKHKMSNNNDNDTDICDTCEEGRNCSKSNYVKSHCWRRE